MTAKSTSFVVLTLAATVPFGAIALAEPPTDKPARQPRMERRAHWAGLTEEERTKLRAAHQKAMADPAVRAAHYRLKQARREFRDVMRPAMLRADPSIQPILEKMRAERRTGD